MAPSYSSFVEAAAAHAFEEDFAQRVGADEFVVFAFRHRLEVWQEDVAERRHADRHRRHFIDKAQPGAHGGAFDDIAGRQPGLGGEAFVNIFAHDRGFDDRPAIVDKRWHHPVGIDREIIGRQVFALGDVDHAVHPLDALLGEANAHLLAAGRLRVVVELKRHGDVLGGFGLLASRAV